MKHLIKILLIFIITPLCGQVVPTSIPLETSPDSSNFEVYSRKGGIETRANLNDLRKYYNPVDTFWFVDDTLKLQFADGTIMSDTSTFTGGSGVSIDTLYDYTALRAYTTASKVVYLNKSGINGLFRQVSSGTDDGGITIVGSDSRIWRRHIEDVIDVKWFGAVADGVTDDQNAIQASIDATDDYINTVYIPAGVYFIDTLIYVEKSGVTVYGDGDSTRLKISNTHTVNRNP